MLCYFVNTQKNAKQKARTSSAATATVPVVSPMTPTVKLEVSSPIGAPASLQDNIPPATTAPEIQEESKLDGSASPVVSFL